MIIKFVSLFSLTLLSLKHLNLLKFNAFFTLDFKLIVNELKYVLAAMNLKDSD